MSFRDKTVSGIKWNFLGQIAGQVASIFFSIALARLINPGIFGDIAMITVIIGFSTIFINLGFGASIIQMDSPSKSLLSTVFWINLGIGLILSITLYLLAQLIENFYHREGLAEIVKILSPVFLIRSIGILPRTILSREINFKSLSGINILSILIGGISAFILAIRDHHVEALEAQILVQALVSNFLVFVLVGWKPGLRFSWSELNKIRSFSLNVLGNNVFNYWVRNIDSLIIGKYLGAYQLGLYNKSYSLLTIPLNNISQSISSVLFPSLSTIKDDKVRIRSVYLKIVSVIAILIFPAMVGVGIVAEKLVLVVLGEEWKEAIPIIKVFCFLAIVQSISSMVTNIYLSLGRANLMFRVGTLLRIMLVASIVIGLNWGILGVAIAYTIAGTLSALINNYIGGKLISLKINDLGRVLGTPALFSIMMGALIYSVDHWVLISLKMNLRLGVQVALGVTFYWLLNEFLQPKAYKELKQGLIKRRLNQEL